MSKLSDLGFKIGSIVETIVTTYNEDGSPNAAPMGVHTLSEREVMMRIHTESDTYSNLMRNNGCVINLVFDPYLFLKTTLIGEGKGPREVEVEKEEVERAEKVDAPFLKEARAYLEAKLIDHKEYIEKDEYKTSEVSIARCEVSKVAVRGGPVAVSRGLFAAIELAITLSRRKKGDTRRYLEIMEKTLSSEEYEKIKEFLEGRI